MSKPLIPFSWTPASWSLRGDSRELAQAEYEYQNDPYQLAVRKLEITTPKDQLDLALLELDWDYKIIEEYDYLKRKIKLTIDDEVEQKVELIKLDIETNKVDRFEGQKSIANLLEEPWVAVINDSLDLTNGPNGFGFELDWNEYWIDMLRKHGYLGVSDEEVVEQWFSDVCRHEVIQSNPPNFNGGVIYE